jgi:spermidine/putrescine transport system permease protein
MGEGLTAIAPRARERGAGREPAPLLTRRRRDLAARTLQGLLIAFVMLVLFGPLLVLAVFSFNDSSILSLPLKGFTTEWYGKAFDDRALMESLWNSVRVAAIVTPLCLVLGVLSAMGLTRFRFRLRGAVAGFVGVPLVMPWLLIGIGGLLFFSQVQVPLSLWTAGVMHIVVAFPLVTALVSAQLTRIDPAMEEAGLDLGATRRQTLRLVILPLLVPTLAASAIFVFSWSFNNFIVSFFTLGFDNTFPVWVFSSLRKARALPIVNAISTLVSLVQVAVVWITWRMLRRHAERSGQDFREMLGGSTV